MVRDAMADYSEIHKNRGNTTLGAEFRIFNVKLGGT
jgi:hypothetical protein